MTGPAFITHCQSITKLSINTMRIMHCIITELNSTSKL